MAWSVSFDPRALTEVEKLDRPAQKRILRFITDRLVVTSDPRELGKPLTGGKAGISRYRVGDYRLICALRDESKEILVLRVGHRKEIYR